MTDGAVAAPSLSVVIPSRRGYATIAPVLESLAQPIQAVAGEVVVVDGRCEAPDVPPWVRWIPVDETDWLRLTHRGIREARGAVIALGEDHTIPRPDWCAAILRAHEEHPDADLVAGCLVNVAHHSVVGRANFLLLGPPYVPPMPALPTHRPPPSSALSFKRRLVDVLNGPGSLETEVAPRLFAERRIAVDDRIVAEHDQDLGLLGTLANRYAVNRSTYGYSRPVDPIRRREVIRWLLTQRQALAWRSARAACGPGIRSRLDLIVAAVFSAAAGVGGAVGTLWGPGRAPARFY
jgi:hypothetical protein